MTTRRYTIGVLIAALSLVVLGSSVAQANPVEDLPRLCANVLCP
jgi:hypothetical protein